MNSRSVSNLLMILLLCLSGCYYYVPTSDAQRRSSFDAHRNDLVAGQSLETYVRHRTAVLLGGTATVSMARVRDNVLAINFEMRNNTYVGGPAHAAAIAPDGYFLTAAHCVDTPIIYLVFFDGVTPRIARARIVAVLEDQSRELDFAILHVDSVLPELFQWVPDSELAVNVDAVASGFTDPRYFKPNVTALNATCLAGRVQALSPLDDGAVRISHSLPIRKGDSGGPLVSTDGRLIGINRGLRIPWFKDAEPMSVRPHMKWLNNAIEADRAKPHEVTEPMHLSPMNSDAPHMLVAL